MVMATTTRTQNRYDHRLRELVRTTQDMSCAVQYCVPRSVTGMQLNLSTVTVTAVKGRGTDVRQRAGESRWAGTPRLLRFGGQFQGRT
jgi:hypothetical protein